ncbi:hypothetical protein WMY93_003070 [Mugilogobius chulae]|uniref:Aspartyl/asparaginy/proline hydroxylase domain-containing protein n=1 Tax=Mugilogobius chulae TaxID=88201 RepID=A0AAW0PYB5_9GOBI
MHWPLSTLPLPLCTDLGVHSLSGLLWTLLLLFLWHCYRMGTDSPSHHGSKLNSRRAMKNCGGTKCSVRSRGDHQRSPFISMETEEEDEEEERGRGYLTPVLSHALFPAQASSQAKKLYAALQEYAKRYSWVGMGRIHKGLREQERLVSHCTIQKPHLFYLPTFPAIYQRGIDTKHGWTSMGPKGQAVFPLYSAGVCVAGNCRSCPCTYRTLLSLRTFINSNSLGSAGFWLLGPGATLGSSYGPTNTRLRCHLGLQTPPECELVVGGEPQCWSEGHCLLVDDSFLHTLSHKGPQEAGPRVILSVDLWHPNVAAAERQALDFMFSPEP